MTSEPARRVSLFPKSSAFGKIAASLLTLLLLTRTFPATPALADNGDCSQPLSDGSDPAASDCLFILKAAVGSATCELVCICAPKGTLPVSATAALLGL